MLIARILVAFCIVTHSIQFLDLETVLSKSSQYIQDYERRLGIVIARETYVQRIPIESNPDMAISNITGDLWAGFRLPKYHELHMLSDFLMVQLEGEDDRWMGFRAVVEVDGRVVRDRLERLREVLEGPLETAIERWRKVAQESARYNIGGFSRSTNVPTFAFLVLRDEHRQRFEFERIGDERIEDVNVWVIRYRERESPTLIRDPQQQEDVFIYGRLWIDPTDGRLIRTEVRTGDENSDMRSEITVRYQPNAELGIWVPMEMKESYETNDGHYLEATATYSDFQQFRVGVESLPVK